jgi:hypothetical protein
MGAYMRQDAEREIYRAAFAEAYSELEEIFGEFERLRVRRARIEKVVEVLKPKVGSDEAAVITNVRRTIPAKGFTVVTRFTVAIAESRS